MSLRDDIPRDPHLHEWLKASEPESRPDLVNAIMESVEEEAALAKRIKRNMRYAWMAAATAATVLMGIPFAGFAHRYIRKATVSVFSLSTDLTIFISVLGVVLVWLMLDPLLGAWLNKRQTKPHAS